MSQIYSKHEALAIAFLTGQATSAQLAEYRKLYASDAGFKEIVDDVETWLAPLNDAIPDQMPPTGLLDDIMQEIEQHEETNISSQPAKSLLPTNDNTILNSVNDNSLRKWRAMAFASSIVAALAVGSHFVSLNTSSELPVPNPETFMALLSDSTQPELMAIVYEPKTGKVVARLSNITVPEDGDLQLWLIREGESAPISLGVLNKADDVDRIELLAPLVLQTGTDTLAISLEALGGSKSAGPEGPVLYTGTVSAL